VIDRIRLINLFQNPTTAVAVFLPFLGILRKLAKTFLDKGGKPFAVVGFRKSGNLINQISMVSSTQLPKRYPVLESKYFCDKNRRKINV